MYNYCCLQDIIIKITTALQDAAHYSVTLAVNIIYFGYVSCSCKVVTLSYATSEHMISKIFLGACPQTPLIIVCFAFWLCSAQQNYSKYIAIILFIDYPLPSGDVMMLIYVAKW